MRKKPTGKRTATYSIDLELQDRLKMASFDMSRMEGRHVSMSEIVENALKKHLDYFRDSRLKRFGYEEGELTIIKPKKTAKIESKPLEGVKPKATTPKPKKQGKDSQGGIHKAIYKGKQGDKLIFELFEGVFASQKTFELSTNVLSDDGKPRNNKKFLDLNPREGCKVRFKLQPGKNDKPQLASEIEIL